MNEISFMTKEGSIVAIRVIFAPLTGRKSDASVLAAAEGLANRFDAHIDVVSLRADPRDAIPYMGEGLSGALVEDFIAQVEAETAEQGRRAHHDFDAWREKTGFAYAETRAAATDARGTGEDGPSCSWREMVGASDQSAAAAGRLADLIIAPRGKLEGEVENEVALEAALFDSGRPVLLAPSDPQSQFGNRIAVAWDGSAEAARALGAALPFLKTAESVTAISVAEDNKPNNTLEDLARYASWHGIQIDTNTVAPDTVTVGEALFGAVRRVSADMLVMGAYSHNRFRELVFGGTTRYILDESGMPVLMTH